MIAQISVSAQDAAAYRRDGAVVLRGILGPQQLRLLEDGIEEAYANPGSRYSRVRSPDGQGETFVEQYVSQRSPSLKALMDSGLVGEIAARLMDTPSAQLILDQLFYKSPGVIVPTPWHQDTPFLRVRGQDMIRVWMPCDSSPPELTVQVVRGSHRWNVVYNAQGGEAEKVTKPEVLGEYNHDDLGDDHLPPPPDVARYRDSFDIVQWDVQPGDVLVFQGNMLHGAQGLPWYDRPRRAFASMWGGPELRYHAPRGKAFPAPGSLGGDAMIPHGARIGDHEDAFPVGWRARA
ncbi:MAG: phytanoyl-CoA dioxygenase family protein [Sphingobium sp.]